MNEYIHQGEMHMACPSRGTRGSGGGATVTHCNTPYTPLFAVTQRPNPGSPGLFSVESGKVVLIQTPCVDAKNGRSRSMRRVRQARRIVTLAAPWTA
jgi:hypothetical protein